MTREEAIKEIKMEYYNNAIAEGLLRTNQAFDMAIEALKQPEIVRCVECKHWGNGSVLGRFGGRPCSKGSWSMITTENEFCNRGEKK